MLSDKEKQEMLETAGSQSIREDLCRMAAGRHNPIFYKEKIDLDSYIEYLNCYNEFINHRRRSFKPMIDRLMKL